MSQSPHGLLRQAFESAVDVLGESAKYALIHDLRHSGLDLDDAGLDLQALIEGLQKLLGDETAIIIVERLIKKFDQLQYGQAKKE